MPVTEILVCPLKPGSAIGDADNEASATLRDLMMTISSARGCRGIRFGMQVENPNVLEMMIDWDNIEDHHTFMEQGDYNPFVDRFMFIASEQPQSWHVDFASIAALESTLSAPVTEVCTFYFHDQPPDEYFKSAEQFAAIIKEQQPEGYRGIAFGGTREEIECKGVRGRAVVCTIGWASVEAHMKARETDLRAAGKRLREGPAEIDMHHVMFLGFGGE